MTNQMSATKPQPLLISFLNQFVNQQFLEDIINVSIYQADVNAFGNTQHKSNTLDQFNTFLTDITKDLEKLKKINSLGNYPVSLIKLNITFAKKIIDIKQHIGARLITYDNLNENFSKIDPHLSTIIQRIKTNRIQNINDYKKKLDEILEKIRISNILRSVKSSLNEIDNVTDLLKTFNKTNLISAINAYRKAIEVASNDLAKLQDVSVTKSLSNSIMVGGPYYDPGLIADNIMTYLSSGYAFYKSGYDIIDQNIGGIEAANLHIICGPSNNAKSIFMINLLRSMVLNNKTEFKNNDVILYITLEDDIYKLQRRFGAVLGNTEQYVLKQMYTNLADVLCKKDEGNYSPVQIKNMIVNFTNDALYESIGKYCAFDLNHFREPITVDMIKQLIEYHENQKLHVRMIFIDYIDCMKPSNPSYSNLSDYDKHGIITQELRNLAQESLVPVITITQAIRGTENGSNIMTNDSIGDSIKKVRYADYIYMVRLRRDIQILSDEVKQHIIDPQELQTTSATTFTDLQNQNNSKLTPFEIKITKAKDGDRDMMRYHVFSGNNLRIYQWLSEYYADVATMQRNSSLLSAEVERARMNVQSIGALSSNDILL